MKTIRLLPFAALTFSLFLTACASGPKYSDYGQVFSKPEDVIEVIAFGSSEKDVLQKAHTAASLYCNDAGFKNPPEFRDGKFEYLGVFGSPEQQKAAVGIMESIGDGVKYQKGVPIIGPSVSVNLDPSQAAKDLAEDSFKITLSAICR